jgi:small subunit ribosomal protein S4
MQMLERRLDNVVYRLGFADSRAQARQLVKHSHFQVNGRRVDIPSYEVKTGDVIQWRARSKNSEYFKTMSESLGKRPVPGWLTVDRGEVSASVATLPEPTDIDTTIDTRLIVEFYSRK